MRAAILLILVVLSTSGEARSYSRYSRSSRYTKTTRATRVSFTRPAPRLMPVRPANEWNEVESARETAASRSNGGGWQLGFEAGVIGKSNNSSSDVLGLELFPGFRAFSRHRLGRRFYVRPSLGFFRRSRSEGNASVASNVIELGATVDYVLSRSRRTVTTIGLAQRFEAIFSTISVNGAGGSSAIGYFYRLGPAFGVHHWINPSTAVVFNFEIGVSLASPMRKYVGTTIGLAFQIK